MITKPTVLVIGAGASKPYGFPTGQELRDYILELANPEADLENNPEFFDFLEIKF